MTDKTKSDLVPIRQTLPSISVGAKKIFSVIVDDALSSAKLEVLNNEREYRGGKYYGEWLNGKPHGRGKYIGPAPKPREDKDPESNLIAIGKWRGYITTAEFNDVHPRLSKLIKDHKIKFYRKLGIKVLKKIPTKPRKRDEVYEGNWVDGEKHGEGRYVAPNGTVYEGSFIHGERHGEGRLVGILGTYQGDWEHNEFHGKGKMTMANGNVYEGDFVNNAITGKCKETTSSHLIIHFEGKVTYEGEIVDGRWQGDGICKSADGDIYEGEWKNDFWHGKGTLKYADGAVYEGDWYEGQEHGKGIYSWPSGQIYEGDWYEGQKHGKGKMIYADGDIYEGDWVDDMPVMEE